MIYNIRELRERDIVYRYIQDTRAEFLAEGGDPVDFPDHMNKLGLTAAGLGLIVDDELVTFIELKYGNKK